MPVYTFSTRGKKPQDTELIARVKATCDRKNMNFSGLVVDLLRKWEKANDITQ